MKPIKLEMSAFGSYGGTEIIDFTRVRRGIFLIAGDTGSGKTTVFDAITYALYDETSGGKRSGDMMRSQYAGDHIPTYVELTFESSGEIYTVRRNPNYRRISKRKNKDGSLSFTTESAAVELTMPDGSVFPGKNRETNEKIQEIIGVNAAQFTQISMIAQGEFLKLLHAPSRERKEIFSNIFDTAVYERIQKGLREKSAELDKALKENLGLCLHELRSVTCLPNSPFADKWERLLQKPETGQGEILGLLQAVLEEMGQKEEEILTKEASLREQGARLNTHMARAREWNQMFQQAREGQLQLEDIKKKGVELSKEKERQEQQFEAARDKLTAMGPKLEQTIAGWEGLQSKYEAVDSRQKSLQDQQKGLEQAQKQARVLETRRQRLKEETEQRKEERSILEAGVLKLPDLKQQEAALKEKQRMLLDMEETKRELGRLAQELACRQEQLEGALQDWQKKCRSYEDKNSMFIREQAGILADSLKNGEPCPVCGSTHHPRKAQLSENAVTQQQVEAAKKEQKAAEELLQLERAACQETGERQKALTQVFMRDGRSLFGKEFKAEMLNQALEDTESARKEITSKRLETEEMQKRLLRLTQRTAECEEELNILQVEQEAAGERLYEAKLSYETEERALTELKQELPFSTRKELLARLNQARREKAALEQNREQAQANLQKTLRELSGLKGQYRACKENQERLKSILQGKESINVSALEGQLKQLQRELSVLEEEKLSLAAVKGRNKQALEILTRLYAERGRLADEFALTDGLSRTANGTLRQQARLDLQTYVQRWYFRHIIGEANKRLMKMSGGRFLLKCRDLDQLGRQGEAGLDLDVYDLVSDNTRDVKTLSGGESFLAALSMALGMADVIRKSAGSVRLDTMFIDEGFGSLDEEARSRAIGILHQLAGETRLVGIISHVAEMKEQMDKKLLVHRDEKGSHAQWILEDQGGIL